MTLKQLDKEIKTKLYGRKVTELTPPYSDDACTHWVRVIEFVEKHETADGDKFYWDLSRIETGGWDRDYSCLFKTGTGIVYAGFGATKAKAVCRAAIKFAEGEL